MPRPKLTAQQIVSAATEKAPKADLKLEQLKRRFFADPDDAAAKAALAKAAKFHKATVQASDEQGRPARCQLLLFGECAPHEYELFFEGSIAGSVTLELPEGKYKVVARSGIIFKNERSDFFHVKGATVKELVL